MLVLRGVCAGYRSPVVFNVDAVFEKGRTHCILGPNGSGKSTLLRVIAGVLPPIKGEVLIDGVDPFREPRVKRRIGYVPEGTKLPEDLTGLEFLRLVSKFYYGSKIPADRIREICELLGIEEIVSKPIAAYSFGQKRRLLLAAALVHDPDVIVLDEPTANLDPESVNIVRRVLTELSSEGRTVIFSSHSIEDVLEVAHDVLVMMSGRVVMRESVTGLLRMLPKVSDVLIVSPADLTKILTELGYSVRRMHSDRYVITVKDFENELPRIIEELRRRGVPVLEVRRIGNPLEEILKSAREKFEEG